MRALCHLRNQLVVLFLLWLNISVAFALPSLGTGRMIDGSGQFTVTTTTFEGGASTNGVDHHAYLQTNLSASITLQARIIVDPADVGKTADLLYVAGVEETAPFDGGTDTSYFAVNEADKLINLNLYDDSSVWMAQLTETPFKRGVTLQSEMFINDEAGWQLSEHPSANYYFVGYRLADDSIIYNSTPIVVTSIPSNSISSSSEPILISNVTTPNTALGLIAANGKESIGIFGQKDSQGRLITIDRISLTSQTDSSKNVVITLDANHLPKTMEFPDGSKMEYSNYSESGATGTLRRSDGIVEHQSFLPMPYSDIMKAVKAIQQYEGSPQPTEGSDIPTSSGDTGSATESDCKEKAGIFCKQVENLFWGASQLISIASCAAAGASAVVTGGIAVPLAVWACGSVVLNDIVRLEDVIKDNAGTCGSKDEGTCPIGGEGSCLKQLNNANSLLSDIQSCAIPPSVSGCMTVAGTRLFDGFKNKVLSELEPEKVCSSSNNQNCVSSVTYDQWCRDNGGFNFDYGICLAHFGSKEKMLEGLKQCEAFGGRGKDEALNRITCNVTLCE